MRTRTLVKVIALVVVAICVFFFARHLIHDAQRADRVTEAQGEQGLSQYAEEPAYSPDAVEPTRPTPEATDSISEEPLDDTTAEPLPALTVPTASLGKAKLAKKPTVIFGKLSVRVPSTWCVKNKSSNIEVFFAPKSKSKCKAKKTSSGTFVFSDLTTTSSPDLVKAWKEKSCGKLQDGTFVGGILEEAADHDATIGGESFDFHRLTCPDGTVHYMWLFLSQDKVVTVKNPTKTEIQRAQAAFKTIVWG
jgi:hypothetical protein